MDTPATPPIKGYRHLSVAEVDLINRAKDLANQVGDFVELLAQLQPSDDTYADPRWLNIARTDLQKGFMALARSIAKPQSF